MIMISMKTIEYKEHRTLCNNQNILMKIALNRINKKIEVNLDDNTKN